MEYSPLMSAMAALLTLWSTLTAAQPTAGPSGHWEGSIQVPAQELKIEIDLMKIGDKWSGAITIPAQNLKGFPLSVDTVEGSTVTLSMKAPGNPQFKGTLSQNGEKLAGDFTQGCGTVPFSLSRTGEARIEPQPKSTAITKDLAGSWDGTLDINGTILRLILKLATQPDGIATGALVSVDQGGIEVPIAAVVQKGMHISLSLPTIAGTYEGDLADGVLKGTWTQDQAHGRWYSHVQNEDGSGVTG